MDLLAGSIRCNCSFCRKIRCWTAMVAPQAFRLLAGEEHLAEYRFGAAREQHLFCRHCGVRPFGRGCSPRRGDFVGVNVGCLDDAAEAELAAAPVTYVDGRRDEWDAPPQVSSYL